MNKKQRDFYDSGKSQVFEIDVDALKKRIAKDGRTVSEIAVQAGISAPTIYNMMRNGRASEYSIEKVRMALSPWMCMHTICPSVPKGKRKGKKQDNAYPESLDIAQSIIKFMDDDPIAVIDTVYGYIYVLISRLNECGITPSEIISEAIDEHVGIRGGDGDA